MKKEFKPKKSYAAKNLSAEFEEANSEFETTVASDSGDSQKTKSCVLPKSISFDESLSLSVTDINSTKNATE